MLPPQHFTGEARLIGGAHAYPGQATIGSAPAGQLSDPADRIFAERLFRRRG